MGGLLGRLSGGLDGHVGGQLASLEDGHLGGLGQGREKLPREEDLVGAFRACL